MKPLLRCLFTLVWSTMFLPAAAPATPVVLSPFEVNTPADRGYSWTWPHFTEPRQFPWTASVDF